jgi:isoleucyl-tRNA synthetase
VYKSVDPRVNFPLQEEEIVRFWEEHQTFKKSVSERAHCPEYVFYDGPPFATGLPHFGHFVPGTIKDIIPRYKTMKGYHVERRFGWDCHGLPVENLIEKELGLDSKTDIERFGIANFNEACRSSVLRYVKEWQTTMTRAGRWVDFDDDYKTMEPDYMESIWWVMKSLWDKGLVYEGHYILPYCPRCSTVLSNHELQLGGYKDVHDPAITIRFKILSAPASVEDCTNGNSYLIAWTTTPWTLPSNLALALGPNIDYVCVVDGNERYILAESRLSSYYKHHETLTISWKKKGSELAGIRYEPLFPYFAELAEKGAFVTVTGDHVSTEDGTGIVHTAPGFGEEDYQVLKGTGIPTVCPIDAECKFTHEVHDYAGQFVKSADKAILERLKAEGKLVKREQILHAYPHCWRCEHPLIYRAVGSWFVKVPDFKQKMLDANEKIHWVPSHIKNGRFGKWLENAREWAISRNRYWGNPLPIWKCDSCNHSVCIGSRDELQAFSGVRPDDLHKHFVDTITWKCDCGGTMTRIPEVLDCWFESGAMPYAQSHYPFENKEKFEANYPSDFISESLDQTRGWFYTLTVLAAALFDSPAFQNCIVSGMVLAADGKKMSKSQRNYTDPNEIMDKFGADALRLYLMNSPVLKADDLCFTDEGVREVLKSVILPIWNAYGFFVTYANIDGIHPGTVKPGSTGNILDAWILSVCEKMVMEVGRGLEAYEMQEAISPIIDFIDSLNNWYIRRSRRRFWKSENDSDKTEAYNTLHHVLRRLVLVAAPFMPFITEAIYQNLRSPSDPDSVHLCRWPEYDDRFRNPELERDMASVRHAVSMGRALRVTNDLKTRQPLASVQIVTKIAEEKKVLSGMEDILREELNVKSILFKDNEEDLVEYSIKANFRVLGKILGKEMKAAAAILEALDPASVSSIVAGFSVFIDVSGQKISIDQNSVEIRRTEKPGLKVLNEGTLTLALDTVVTPSLLREGYVRDLIRGVQNLRKESGLDVTDRINLAIAGDTELKKALDDFGDFVAGETLADSIAWREGREDNASLVEAGEKTWYISLSRA